MTHPLADDAAQALQGVTPEAVANLAERLRGEYRIPITDGMGAAGGDEPDNAHEFVRHFPAPPIQMEAAAALTALSEQNAALVAKVAELTRERDALADGKDGWKASSDEYERLFRAAEAKVAELTRERDRFEAALARACLVGGTTYLIERAEAAEAKVARLEGARVISAATHCSCGNTGPCMWSDCKHPWAETPEGTPE